MYETRMITLADGRDLAWLEMGDPHGKPVFAFHGTPGSRLSFVTDDSTIDDSGVRLICPDRPGYGHSSFHRGRRLPDWPGDVAQLADHLGTSRFGVIGVSGGGPHALACAALLPQQVTAAAIVSGVGPLHLAEATDGMLALNRFNTALSRRAPVLTRPLSRLMADFARRSPDRAIDEFIKRMPPADRAVLARPEVRAAFTADMRQSSRTSGRAASQDFALFAHDWGFALGDITVPVHFWQGDADINVPPHHARLQHEAIPGSVLIECPAEGHLLVFAHVTEILDFLRAH